MDVVEAMKALAKQLDDGGLRAVIDARDLNPPSALVKPPTLNYRFKDGCWNADWQLWLVVPGSGQTNALTQASALLEMAQLILGGVITTARPDDVVLIDGSTCQMYVATWTAKIPA